MLYLTGRALYGPAVGFWSAIVFDTLPGLSYSSLLITTDVPLILFWTIALYAWVMLVKRQSMGFAILLGVAIGFGLLAKQAMIYAFLCMACHAAVSREARQALRGGRLVVVVLLAFALFVPNVIWNAEHGFPPPSSIPAPTSAGSPHSFIPCGWSSISGCSSGSSGPSCSPYCCAQAGARSVTRQTRTRSCCSPSRYRCSRCYASRR